MPRTVGEPGFISREAFETVEVLRENPGTGKSFACSAFSSSICLKGKSGDGGGRRAPGPLSGRHKPAKDAGKFFPFSMEKAATSSRLCKIFWHFSWTNAALHRPSSHICVKSRSPPREHSLPEMEPLCARFFLQQFIGLHRKSGANGCRHGPVVQIHTSG